MKILYIHLGKALMRIIYSIFKLFPTKKKVVFLSRQTNKPSVDFVMLSDEITARDSEVQIVMICGWINSTPKGLIRLAINTFSGMYHTATARVAILDTYSPIISLLKHKQELTVIQIWHAMGKIKQSGHQNLDTPGGGRCSKVAKVMNMHKGYDLIVAGASTWNKFYCESFNVSEEILYNVGLPRIDFVQKNRELIRKEIFSKYAGLGKKPIILYAPTWRNTEIAGWDELIHHFDFHQYDLVVKSHPRQKLTIPSENVYTLPGYSALECLAIAEFLITDYSATAVEAAAFNIKTYYYLYDFEQYKEENGLNIDLFQEMKDCVFTNAIDLVKALENPYPMVYLENYKKKFLPKKEGSATVLITNKIMEGLKLAG